ncbi:DUF2264 domain-containing protein [Lacticaseibacillus sp. GG6-2]
MAFNIDDIKNNPIKTRADLQRLAKALVAPTEAYFDDAYPGHLNLGSSGTVYPEDQQEIEAFLRPLWAIGPLLSDPDQDLSFFDKFKKGLLAGTDPASNAYWGDLTNTNQLMVEEASIALTLVLTKSRLWDTFSTAEKQRVHDWLIQINYHSLPNNNWHYFRVLVNMSMSLLGMDYSQAMMNYDFSQIDAFYVDHGWYKDGLVDQQDYYVSWAVQFYGLVYSKLYGDKDPKRAAKLQKRAATFATTFQYWFDANGAGLPYGRSLIYRFAQSAFWSALAFAGVEALPWGQIKHLVLQNLRYWMQKPIFKPDGILTLGYEYDNLNFTEGYNGPGSPYWALKPFLILALPESHPFWQAKEEAPQLATKCVMPDGRMFVTRDSNGQNVQGFTAGQLVNNQSHREAKYSKFVYSTRFGFSTPKDGIMLNEEAYDNTLALCEAGDHHYRTRELVNAFCFTDDYVYSNWQPWSDVTIESYVIPMHPWHIRVHLVHTNRALTFADGGFANEITPTTKEETVDHGVVTTSPRGVSGAFMIQGAFTQAMNLRPEPNTNLLFPKSVIPTLTGSLPVGDRVIIDAFIGAVNADALKAQPTVTLKGNVLTITAGSDVKTIDLGQAHNGKLQITSGDNA